MSAVQFMLRVVLVGGTLLGVVCFSVYSMLVGPGVSQAVVGIASAETLPAPTTTVAQTTTTTTLPPTTTTTIPPRGELVIQGTGDVLLDPAQLPVLLRTGWDYAWWGMKGLFLEDDLTVINLECTPSNLGSPVEKTFNFRCPPESLPSLAANGVEVASLANNHSGDYGPGALIDGLHNVLASGVAAVGVGVDETEAGKPALFEIDGWTIAVLGFGGVAPSSTWYAGENQAGMRNGDDRDGMVEAVAAADAVADIVVVGVHWGVEKSPTPAPGDVALAHAMVDAGADIIFGHHPHRLQPLEMIDGAAVFYSLGNFVWPDLSPESSKTGVARVVVDPSGDIQACILPAQIATHGHPVLTGRNECGVEAVH